MSDSQLIRWVKKQIQAGEDSVAIIQQLVKRGYNKKDALRIVELAFNETQQSAPIATGPAPTMLLAVMGGLFAAVVGGVLWAAVALATQSETGFIAWAIGGLCGFAVLLLGKGEKGPALQLTAAICSILGIVIGKYGTFFFLLRGQATERLGNEAAEAISLFSPEVLQAFFEGLPEAFSSYDLMWVGLAVVTAWRIPRAAVTSPTLQSVDTSLKHDSEMDRDPSQNRSDLS